MKLRTTPTQYMEQQKVFTGEMIARIADHLEESGITGKFLKELTGKIAFEIACIIDDVSGIEFDGVDVNPYLTFISKEDDFHLGGNSTTHEMVFGILNAIFDKNIESK